MIHVTVDLMMIMIIMTPAREPSLVHKDDISSRSHVKFCIHTFTAIYFLMSVPYAIVSRT